MEIHWGKGSAFNLGRIPDSEIRVERVKDQDNKFYFLLSDRQWTYLYCDNKRYETLRFFVGGVSPCLPAHGRCPDECEGRK